MRPTAKVFPVALPVDPNFLVRRDAFDDLRLVLLADAAEIRNRVVTAKNLAADFQICLGQFMHFFLDGDQVFRGKRPLERKIIEKSIFDNRSDRHLRFRKQSLDRLCQQMRSRMANDFEAVGVLGGNDFQACIVANDMVNVDQPAIYAPGQRSPRQTRSDIGRNGGYADWFSVFLFASIWQRNDRHNRFRQSTKRGVLLR